MNAIRPYISKYLFLIQINTISGKFKFLKRTSSNSEENIEYNLLYLYLAEDNSLIFISY